MSKISTLLLSLLLISSCGGSSEPSDSAVSSSTSATPTTSEATTTTSSTTTSTTTTIAATTTSAVPPVAARVVWDGKSCSYEGPETVPVGTVISVQFSNEAEMVADLEIDYLPSDVTLEQGIAAWPAEMSSADQIPANTYFVTGIPEYPQSVEPGAAASAEVKTVAARIHTFICFQGGANAAVQSVSVATKGLTVTEV